MELSEQQRSFLRDVARRLLRWHLAIFAGMVVIGLIVVARPELADRVAPTEGPATNTVALIVSLVLTWVLVTVVLLVSSRRRLRTDDLILLLGTAMLSLLYLVVLREHVVFGDFGDYIDAARAIRLGEHFPARYLYPPPWAWIISWVQAGFGERAAEIFCFMMSHVSLVAFMPLTVVLLGRCGISRQRATLLVLCALAVSAPVMRNLVYVQVNFLVLDLLLVAVLASRRHWLMAGLALALGTHLKVFPLLLLPLFIIDGRWRLLGAYFVGLALLFAATAFPHGLSYWEDFLRNLEAWQAPALRSASLPGMLVNTVEIFDLSIDGRLLALPLQLALVAHVAWLAWRAMSTRVLTRGFKSPSGRLIDGVLPALFLWPILSPGVWVYHLVVLIPPAVLMATRVTSPRRSAFFALCYFLVFLSPTVDIYPLSYLRLAGWLGLLALLTAIVRED